MNTRIGSLLRLLLALRCSTGERFLEPEVLLTAPFHSFVANVEDSDLTPRCRSKSWTGLRL